MRPNEWTCPGCATTYRPGFVWDLDVCEACEQEDHEIPRKP